MRLPDCLQNKDQAIIVSPSGNIDENLVYDTAEILKDWGLNTKISKYALNKNGRFSGTIDERLHDLQEAFDNPNIRLIFCSRGGYGLVHLLDKLNFEGIKKYPKWVLGFSDITALHSALQVNGIASLHAPMAKYFSENGAKDLSVLYTKSLLYGQSFSYEIPVIEGFTNSFQGHAKGKLFGGNLSVLCGLIGTPYFSVPDKGILFLEDIGESPYRVDRMIYQLKLAGIFNKISGLILGDFTDYDEDERMYCSLIESILDVTKEYRFPIALNFPAGHDKINFPLILGKSAELIVEKDKIKLIQ